MKKVFAFVATFALFASTQAFAIAGIGAHYVMNTGSLDASEGPVGPTGQVKVVQKSASGLQGLGFKAWIDFLPFIDIEGTFNVAATRYETSLIVNGTEIPLRYTPGAPYNMIFDRADPLYGIFSGDVSVTYPVVDIIPFVRPYVGAGVSYLASIPIVNASFVNNMDITNPETLDGKVIEEALKNADYKGGIGGHIIAGIRIKPPVIAIYANGKYYFGGDVGKQFTQGFVLEVGGGFGL
ncbi:MAG: hypothetical protein LBQ87_07805 [Candidatus Fibromonas sp.]|jgi:hypothetical protein|nr:hypothetical protein [Candidatus Fibromonas sp.]